MKNSITISVVVAILVCVGIVMLTSTSVWIESDASRYSHLTKQGLFLLLGVTAAYFLSRFDYTIIRKKKWLVLSGFIVSTLLLICLYIPGVGHTVNGSTRWLQVPVLGAFQPSELAKLTTMVALAYWFAHYQAETRSLLKGFVWPSLILGMSVGLIFFEKDMGTAASLGAAGLSMIFIAGVRLRYIIPSVLSASYLAYYFVQSDANRWGRIMAFMDLEKHALGFGYQQMRALYAFGNGGFYGTGIGYSAEKRSYLAFAHTDFIFPVIGEELGWVTFLVVLCFVIYAVFGIRIALQAKDVFGRLLAIGLTTVVVVPAMVNIGVTTASLPNTGLPLPFVSYGGTNLVVTLASVGLLISISLRSKEEVSERPLKVSLPITDIRI